MGKNILRVKKTENTTAAFPIGIEDHRKARTRNLGFRSAR